MAANCLQSDDESSDEEDEEGKDDEKKEGEGKDGHAESKDKAKGGAPKGTLTPQGKQKHGDLVKKTKSLKRAGSPALSESSGNESSRKKMKKSRTTAPGSRAGTPLPQGTAVRRPKVGGAGSGSDGEATGGEMSDGAGPRKKIKVMGSSAKGTPAVSRAGSPNPAPGGKSTKISYELLVFGQQDPLLQRRWTNKTSSISLLPGWRSHRTVGNLGEDSTRRNCYRRSHQTFPRPRGR